MSVKAPKVIVWSCPAGHAEIFWRGSIACCTQCPMTSELTEFVMARGRAAQRALDVEYFREEARKVAAAREAAGNGEMVYGTALPASILDRAAALLESAPIGDSEPGSIPAPRPAAS